MKGEVINTFRDKFHYNTVYEVGTVVDFEKERMEDLVARGLCKKVKETAKKADSKADKKKKTVLDDTKPKEKEDVLDKADGEVKEGGEELDEKAKSELEAAEKIAKATAKQKKN